MSRKRQSRAAATDHLPPAAAVSMELALNNKDLLMQILVLLPAKSLIRFKSVCKNWLSTISSDHLCHQHTLRRPKLQQSLIIQMHSEKLFYLNSEKVMIPYRLSVLDSHQIVQACNGLLLLESKSRKKCFYVYNPTTRRLRKVILTKRGDFPYVVAITLAFDPSKSPYYKLACFRSRDVDTNTGYYAYQIEVYDSERHTWKLSCEGSAHHPIYDNGLYWNNYIFWNTTFGHNFRFDIAKNEVVTQGFTVHPYNIDDDISTYLAESNGLLYVFVLLESAQHVEGVVREMGRDGCWKSEYLGVLHGHPVGDNGDVSLMVRSGGDGSTYNVIAYEAERRRIIAYNYLDEESELLVDLTRQPVSEFDHVMSAFQFGEVLALV